MLAEREWQTLLLPKPPSVNALYANNKSGRGRGRYKTKAYKRWEQAADIALMQNRLRPISGEYELEIRLGRRRGSDAPNYEKAISDWLQSRAIVTNDSLGSKITIEWDYSLKAVEARIYIRPVETAHAI